MPRIKLDQYLIKELPLPARGQTFYWDETLPGFGVRVTAHGKCAFVIQIRHGKGRQERKTLGSVGKLAFEDARLDAEIFLGRQSRGRKLRDYYLTKIVASIRQLSSEALKKLLVSLPWDDEIDRRAYAREVIKTVQRMSPEELKRLFDSLE